MVPKYPSLNRVKHIIDCLEYDERGHGTADSLLKTKLHFRK